MVRTHTIKEWNNRRILSQTLFQFMYITNGEDVVYSSNTGKYIISAKLSSGFNLNIYMTALEIYNMSETITIEHNY